MRTCNSTITSIVLACLLVLVAETSTIAAVLGDVDGNNILDIEDARLLTSYLVRDGVVLPSPENADVTQNGVVDMDDAFAIAKRVSGQSRVVVVATLYGDGGRLEVGDSIRIEVFDHFFPFDVETGSVTIESVSAGYNSGDQPLTVNQDGRSLYYMWDTGGLEPANDYAITVTLIRTSGTGEDHSGPDVVAELYPPIYNPPFLADVIDAAAPVPGVPLVFRRMFGHDPSSFPYLGCLGRGWVHNYDVKLSELTDGRIVFHGPTGYNRFFTSNDIGTYDPSPGDSAELTRDNDGSFNLREKDGLVYRFTSDLQLEFIEDRNGNKVTMIYDTDVRLGSIIHSAGPSFTLTYDDEGFLSTLTDHAGRETHYSISSILATDEIPQPPDGGTFNRDSYVLKTVIDASGAETKYEYTLGPTPIASYRISSIQYPDASFSHFTFDARGRLTRTTGTWGANPVDYKYGIDGTVITDAVGSKTTYVLDGASRQPSEIHDPDGGVSRIEYDSHGNAVRTLDPLGNEETFEYDAFHNLTLAVDGEGGTSSFGYESTFNQLLWQRDHFGHETSYEYDAKGNLTAINQPDSSRAEFEYNSNGVVILARDGEHKETSFGINSYGQTTSITNANGGIVHFSYTPAGDLEEVRNAKDISVVSYLRDELGRETRRTYPDGSFEQLEYDAAGNLTNIVKRGGQSIGYSYDITGKLVGKTLSNRTYQLEYDDRGFLSKVEKTIGGGTPQMESYYEFDRRGNMVLYRTPQGAGEATFDVSYAYDDAGNRTLMVYPDGYELHYTYDQTNRLKEIRDKDNNLLVAYERDGAGRRIRRDLGNGTYTTYSYDNANRLTALTNLHSDASVQSFNNYTHNAAGIRTSMTTSEGTHNYGYDNTYQVTSVQYPDGHNVEYQFDAAGNRTSVIDNGVTSSYTVNALDQYTQAGSETLDYDNGGNLVTRSEGTDVTSYGWDEESRLISVNRNSVQIDYEYDYQGRLIAKTIVGQKTSYIWDSDYLVAEVNESGQVVKRYVYGNSIDEVILVIANGTNYWCLQDGLGSVVATTDNNGAVVGTCSYDIYGNVYNGDLGPVPHGLAGMRRDTDADLYYVRERWYSPSEGKFLSPDPVGLIGEFNLSAYVGNNPVNITDLIGLSGSGYSSDTSVLTDISRRERELGRERFEQEYGGLGSENSLFENSNHNIRTREGNIDLKWFLQGYTTKQEWDWSLELFIRNGVIKMLGGGLYELAKYISGNGSSVENTLTNWDSFYLGWYWKMSGMNLADFAAAFGLCPTFIQGGTLPDNLLQPADVDNALICQLNTPWSASLLRSDIPIYGYAGGTNFKKYMVEYTEDISTDGWEFIAESDVAEMSAPAITDTSWMQGDLNLEGNLATWNVGLKNWEHLPWHRYSDEVDLNGIYTLRLTVEGKDGSIKQDSVTVEVGRVIAQCLPGTAVSAEKRVTMHFPEQSLQDAFRIYTIIPFSELDQKAPETPKGSSYVGEVYRIREPGDQFIKDVTLEIVAPDNMDKKQSGKTGICQYNPTNDKWDWLETLYHPETKSFTATLSGLQKGKAYYSLIQDKTTDRSVVSNDPPTVKQDQVVAAPQQDGLLFGNDFEEGPGTFKDGDRLVGARVELNSEATPDGSKCLAIRNESFGGNFSATVFDRSFDVRAFNRLQFDYRMGPGTKTDIYLLVEGHWYRIRFSGDAIDFHNKDVNITTIGSFDSIVCDGKWHKAGVNLEYLLSRHTRNTVVDRIMFADWRVDGYMKLAFGDNARNATLYLDNVALSGTGEEKTHRSNEWVDAFETPSSKNFLGKPTGIYCNPGSQFFSVSMVDLARRYKRADNGDRALKLKWNLVSEEAYGGYWSDISNRQLKPSENIMLDFISDKEIPNLSVGLRDKVGKETRVHLSPQYVSVVDSNWSRLTIPLSQFVNRVDLENPEVIFIAGSKKESSGKGSWIIDNLRIAPTGDGNVASFDGNIEANEAIIETETSGAAAISASVTIDPVDLKSDNQVCRISYGGNIGKDYGRHGGFSYAIWKYPLNGLDARVFDRLEFRIRGDKGGKLPNIYLATSGTRVCYPLKAEDIGEEWQTVSIPLNHFINKKLDMSMLDYLQLVYEWEEHSGTIYVDDIRFTSNDQRAY